MIIVAPDDWFSP